MFEWLRQWGISAEELDKFKEEYVLSYGVDVLAALVIFIVGWLVTKVFRQVVRSLMRRAKVDEILVSFISNILYAMVLAFVIIAALNKLGVQTASLVAVIGAAGLAIGLALQGSLSNFAAGVMIILFRYFKVGDYIQCANGTAGTVYDMNIFTTTLMTITNERVVVPNATFTTGVMTNFTANDYRRIDLILGIGYGDDIVEAKSVIEGVIAEHPLVQDEPEPFIGVDSWGDSSINLTVRVWVPRAEYLKEKCQLLEDFKYAFDREGISIPFPQRDVHHFQVAPPSGTAGSTKKKAASKKKAA